MTYDGMRDFFRMLPGYNAGLKMCNVDEIRTWHIQIALSLRRLFFIFIEVHICSNIPRRLLPKVV